MNAKRNILPYRFSALGSRFWVLAYLCFSTATPAFLEADKVNGRAAHRQTVHGKQGQVVAMSEATTTAIDVRDVVACALVLWATAELLFIAAVVLYLAPRMNRLENPPKYPMDNKRLMFKVLETVDWLSTHEDSKVTFESFLSGWFLGAPLSELRRENVWDFLAWTMYAKHAEKMSKAERKNVLDMVKVFEERLGRILAPGHNPNVRCIRHTLDPVVPFTHRPLFLYALLGATRVCARAVLSVSGFRRLLAPCGRFSYWHREASMSDDGPIVFFHGVCTGLPSYLLAIWRVCRGRTSIVIESPSISMNLHLFRGHTPPTENELVDSVEGIMTRHRLRRAMFFGHSFGSIAVAWMARRRPDLVSQIALLDPVCLLLFLPDVAKAFLHPDSAGLPWVEKLLLFLVSHEKGMSHTLRRHFWWYQNVLWPQDIRCPMVVGLAGLDKIAPANPMRRYLLSYPGFAKTPVSCEKKGTDGVRCNTRQRRRDQRPFHGGRIALYATCAPTSDMSVGRTGVEQSAPWVPDEIGTIDKPAIERMSGAVKVERNGGKHRGINVIGKARVENGAVSCRDDVSVVDRDGWATKVNAQPAESEWVETVYWPNLGHGHPLGVPQALDEFMLTVARQAKDFGIVDERLPSDRSAGGMRRDKPFRLRCATKRKNVGGERVLVY